MDDASVNARLSRISTIWTLLEEAHGTLSADVRGARLELVQRYQGAAYRYLLGAVRDLDTADELFQEFALRVMQGAFWHVTSERGRFRDYLKTCLYHLVVEYQKRQARRPIPLDSSVQPAPWGVKPFCPMGSRDRLRH